MAYNEDGREQAGRGATAADYDGDGHIDLFKTNFSDDTATLYHASGDGSFTEVTSLAGFATNSDALGWGTMFADADNDGWPDLLVVNGHVYPEVDGTQLGATFKEPRFLYRTLGNGKFSDLAKCSGPRLTEPLAGHGLAIADLWNDGRLSAVVNNSGHPGHSITLQLQGTVSNRAAYGARIDVLFHEGVRARHVYRTVGAVSSFGGNPMQHTGIGSAAAADEVHLRWPAHPGKDQVFRTLAAGSRVLVREGDATLQPLTAHTFVLGAAPLR